jgi:AAA-like domain
MTLTTDKKIAAGWRERLGTLRPSPAAATATTPLPPTTQADLRSPSAASRRRRKRLLDRLGWYEYLARAIESTTRQIAGLFLATSSSPTSHEGIFIGKEQHTGWPFFHDVFSAYRDKLISSPNVIILGGVGFGKSSLIKTWAVLRQLMLGRRVVVIDKKRQQRAISGGGTLAEGEYAVLCRALGVEPIRFILGRNSGGSKINVLDPAIGGADDSDGGASQLQLLRAVLREALGRKVAPLEGKALRVAHRVAVTTARAEGRIATILDVVTHLDYPSDASLAFVNDRTTVEMLTSWGQEAAAELERMIDEDLAGLIDGETSADISLTAGLTVFDISALPEDGPAVPIVMAIVNSWLRAVLDNQDNTVPTVFVVEEGWHIVSGTFAKVTRRNQKISRGEALMNVTALHHVSDIAPDSPAIATIQEAETVIIYRQDKTDDARRCVELFNLPASCLSTLMELPKGAALIKIGSAKPVLVTHLRSAWEESITNTDGAMESEATVALHAVAGAADVA